MSTGGKTEIRVSSAHMFELLMDSFPDIIQSVDGDGTIVYANRKAADLLGYRREEILGMHVSQLYAPEIWDKVQRGFAALKNRGSLTVLESLIRDKAGNRIPVEIRSFAVYDDDGHFLRTFSILRDIREIKDLQSSLLQSSRLAAIGELSACIAHDINNPLAVARLYIELLLTQTQDLAEVAPESSEIVQNSLASAQKALEKIERLTLHLREFSRVRDTHLELIDLRSVIGDALFMVTNRLEKSGVTVVHEVPEGACMLKGNAGQLEQALMNLFSNACDAMREKQGAELRIETRRIAEGARRGFWEVRVGDNGTGIRPELRDQIFTPFFTTKPKGEGTGLGLSITRNVVRRHGGQILLESEIGKGSVFILYLPENAEPLQAAGRDESVV